MPKLKHFTAQRDMHMDCGHLVKTGETFHVASVFTCDKEGSWPLRVLMACLAPKAKAPQDPTPDRQDPVSDRPEQEQTAKSAPAHPPVAKTQA